MRREYWLYGSVIAVGALYLMARTQRGQQVASDALEGIIVTAKSAGAAVADVIVPRGIRNNNPGNLRWIENPSQRWRGMVDQDVDGYAIFDTIENGVRAIGGELRASIRRSQTLQQAIYEWAPPTENNTDAYVASVSEQTGLPPSWRLVNDNVPSMAAAIIYQENGVQPYDAADIAAWVNS